MGLPRSDTDRIAKYNAKVAAATVALKVAARLERMKSDYATFAQEITAIEISIKSELADLAGPSIATYPLYLSFGRELWKAGKTYSQPLLDAYAQVIADKWITRGCDCAMCQQIAYNVFNITITCPTP
jgi:hypothetical protein